GTYYFYSNKFEKSLDYYSKSEKIALEIGDSSIYYSDKIRKAIIKQQMDPYTSEDTYLHILEAVTKANDYENIILCNNALGYLSEQRHNRERSMEYYLVALDAAEKLQDPYYLALVLNNIGLSKMYNEQYENGLEDLKEGLSYAD